MLLNQQRAAACMRKHGVDALIATQPNHVTYASNYGGHSPRIYPDRMVYAILPLDMRAALLAPIGDASYLAENRASIWVPEIWTYGTSKITWPADLQPDADERRLIAIIQDKDHNAKSLPELIARVLESRGLGRGCRRPGRERADRRDAREDPARPVRTSPSGRRPKSGGRSS